MHTPYETKTGHKSDFRVRYKFCPPREGAEARVRKQGYRCNFWYGEFIPGQTYVILPEFEDENFEVISDTDATLPTEGTARMWIVFKEARKEHAGRIYVGLKCFFMEAHIVAECEVIEITGLETNPG